MANDAWQVSRNAKWSIAQTIISAGVLFFLYRFLLKSLGAEQLGLWSLILASTSLARIGELGFSSATLRFVGKYVGAGERKEAAEVLETALLTICLPFAGLVLLAVPIVITILPWFVPAKHMAEVEVILPWAMLALWMGITSSLVQSAIEGCGRMDQKNMVLIGTNIIYLALTLLLAPIFGLKGVAIAQAVQAGSSLFMMWLLARAQLPGLPAFPRRWRKTRFQEVATFAVSMQVGSIATMLVEPLSKAFISRFGGLEFLAYYEMANQVITRARSVLISGLQAIMPQFSITSEKTKHKELFLRSQKQVVDRGVPFMSLLIIGFPCLSYVWVGRIEPTFIIAGQLVGIAWLLNAVMIPAYFFLVGTGRGLKVAAAQFITLVGTLALGWVGGKFIGGSGPIIGSGLALLLGNVYMYYSANKILFHDTQASNMPRWIVSRMWISGTVCSTIIGLHFLATKYATEFIHHLIIAVISAAAIGIFAFVIKNRIAEG